MEPCLCWMDFFFFGTALRSPCMKMLNQCKINTIKRKKWERFFCCWNSRISEKMWSYISEKQQRLSMDSLNHSVEQLEWYWVNQIVLQLHFLHLCLAHLFLPAPSPTSHFSFHHFLLSHRLVWFTEQVDILTPCDVLCTSSTPLWALF